MPTDSPSPPRLSVILPGFNERAALPIAVAEHQAAFEQCELRDYELIVVNDGSTDGTGELAEELAENDKHIRVIHHPENRGAVAAVLNGFSHSTGQIVTHNGMDLPFHPRDTGHVLRLFDEGADVVVVERDTRQAYGFVRKLISWCNSSLVNLLFDTPFRDHNFVQFYRREVIESVAIRSRGVSTVTPELILRSRRSGYRVVGTTAPYHARHTGKSTITPSKVLHTVVETFRLRWLMRLPDRRT